MATSSQVISSITWHAAPEKLPKTQVTLWLLNHVHPLSDVCLVLNMGIIPWAEEHMEDSLLPLANA